MKPKQPTALIVCAGDDTLASTRVRARTVADELSTRGWSVTRTTLRGYRWFPLVLKAVISRRDLLILQKVTPPELMTKLLARTAKASVFEIDDAVYLGYPGGSQESATQLRARVTCIVNSVDRVVTSNKLISDDLNELAPQGIEVRVFPGPAPEAHADNSKDGRHQLIWLGSPSTFSYFELEITPLLPELAAAGFETVCVGAPRDTKHPGEKVSLRVWSPEVQHEELRRATIGLMPMVRDDWAQRKAAYKLLEYLAYGIVPVCEHSDAVELLLGAEADTLAVYVTKNTPDAWRDGITRASTRRVDADWNNARDAVFSRWSVSNFTDQFLQ